MSPPLYKHPAVLWLVIVLELVAILALKDELALETAWRERANIEKMHTEDRYIECIVRSRGEGAT